MQIGTIKISDMSDKVILNEGVNNVTVSGGRLFIHIEGNTFLPKLPLQKNQIYQVTFNGIEGMNQPILVTFEDYVFNAGSTEYIDESGVKHAGACILANQFQFLIVG